MKTKSRKQKWLKKAEDEDQAAAIAVKTVKDFCVLNPDRMDTVRFILFSNRALAVYDHAIWQLQQGSDSQIKEG